MNPNFETVTFPVLWSGFLSESFKQVRVLSEIEGKLTVLTEENEILTGIDAEQVSRPWREEEIARPPICQECGHFFDPSDGRAFVHTPSERYPDLGHSCPACHQMAFAAEAWALWNGCQGVFADAVFHSKSDALEAMKADNDGSAYEAVVPVRVIVEPKAEHGLREWREREMRRETAQ